MWSLFAALGVFVAGASVSVAHGIEELFTQGASHFAVGYIVLGVSFVLEGISFTAVGPPGPCRSSVVQRDLIEYVLVTSDPTLRGVFAEDSAALIGLVIAAVGLGCTR